MFSPVHGLCSFGAVPFDCDETRRMLVANPAQINFPPMVAGDVDGLAQAIYQRLVARVQPNNPRVEDPPRRPRSRHNAGNGAAEDHPMAPLPDIITSSNPPTSPSLSIDSGVDIGSPRDVDDLMFSFDDDHVDQYRRESSSSSSSDVDIDIDMQITAPFLAPPPRGRRNNVVVDSAEGVDEGIVEDEHKGGKNGYESVVIDMPSDVGSDDDEEGVASADVRVNRRWTRVGHDLRTIADDFHYNRTGERRVQPWTVNFAEFFRLLVNFIWGRIIRPRLGF